MSNLSIYVFYSHLRRRHRATGTSEVLISSVKKKAEGSLSTERLRLEIHHLCGEMKTQFLLWFRHNKPNYCLYKPCHLRPEHCLSLMYQKTLYLSIAAV